MRRLIVLVALLAAGCGTAAGAFTSLYVVHLFSGVATADSNSTVNVQSVLDSPIALPNGGPQALEGYTRVSHDRGTTRLAIGTIGNVEMNARGEAIEIRSLQGGGVITNEGHVAHWSGLALFQPKAGNGYTGPIHVDRVDYVTFDNGWSIRPSGADLLICKPSGDCKPF